MLGDYYAHMKEELIQLKQNWMVIMEYEQKFDTHIIFFVSLGELDRVCIFVNGLDNHIKFMVKAYSPKIFFKAYKGPFTVVVLKNGKMISLAFTNNNFTFFWND
jgi:hypothetical protein